MDGRRKRGGERESEGEWKEEGREEVKNKIQEGVR
jgi:hypothetical protein